MKLTPTEANELTRLFHSILNVRDLAGFESNVRDMNRLFEAIRNRIHGARPPSHTLTQDTGDMTTH